MVPWWWDESMETETAESSHLDPHVGSREHLREGLSHPPAETQLLQQSRISQCLPNRERSQLGNKNSNTGAYDSYSHWSHHQVSTFLCPKMRIQMWERILMLAWNLTTLGTQNFYICCLFSQCIFLLSTFQFMCVSMCGYVPGSAGDHRSLKHQILWSRSYT